MRREGKDEVVWLEPLGWLKMSEMSAVLIQLNSK